MCVVTFVVVWRQQSEQLVHSQSVDEWKATNGRAVRPDEGRKPADTHKKQWMLSDCKIKMAVKWDLQGQGLFLQHI